ncbi:N-methyl-L-tryptophan oxidase [Natronomonas sp. EA1]|uniref:N-methyl-L-tryptophan oxidase n=1 Tax=Natronomonas sp. EA1 TaxID=3421655 RepID=UPI003EB9B9AB
MPNHAYDAIVVGVGGMGSAATYHLARRGLDVLGLERYDVPNAMGSSHGETRMIRKAYHESPAYLPLLDRAYELWGELEADHGQQLLYRTGSVAAGPPDSELVAGARAACETHGLDHETYDSAALHERFPGFDLPEEYEAVYQPDGGFLAAEQCTIAHVDAAHRAGATVRARERVTGWEATETGVRVETDRGSYTAGTLVVAGGAWAPKLLPAFADVLEPQRQVMGWFQPSRPENFTPETFPVFIVDHEHANPDYGFPRFDAPGIKVGIHHHFDETVDPETMAREPRRADEDAFRAFLGDCLPDANGPVLRLSTCLYTNTPDGHFIIDRHPQKENVLVACGFSGHGFKFAPVVGEILADLAVDGETDHPVDRFRADRF